MTLLGASVGFMAYGTTSEQLRRRDLALEPQHGETNPPEYFNTRCAPLRPEPQPFQNL